MTFLTLSQVLAHPSLSAADPRVLAGAGNLNRPVRWIHSSEVLEIAPLLRGGELLLTGGEMLARSGATQHRRYIRHLAERGVAGVAVETGSCLTDMPAAMVEAAGHSEFPLIELRRVVPFVEVAEAINGILVDGEVSRLRVSTALAHALSAIVAAGGGAQEVLVELSRRTGVPSAMLQPTGQAITTASATEPATTSTAARTDDWTGRADRAITSWVSVRGVRAALLALFPQDTDDAQLLALAADRGAEALSVVLLRGQPPSMRDLAETELLHLCRSGSASTAQILRLGETVGMPARHPVIGVAASCPTPLLLRQLHALLRQHGTVATDQPTSEQLEALVSFDRPEAPAAARNHLMSALHAWADGKSALTVAIGPVCRGMSGASLSLSAAVQTLQLDHPAARGIVDTRERLPERLQLGAERQAQAARLVREQFTLFSDLTPPERDRLLTSLECYFDSGCNKTLAAERLHLGRQALYERLNHAFTLLGGDPTGTPLALSVHLAARLRHQRDET